MPNGLLLEQFCNLCRSTQRCEIVHVVNGHRIVACGDCGMVFTAQEPDTIATVRNLYGKEYFEGGVDDGYSDYAACEDTLRHEARRTLRRIRRYHSSGRLLELGCAYGFFLLEAQKYFAVQGVEVSRFAAEQATARGLTVQAAPFETLELSPGVDVVCLFDCIEHLLDPFAYLQKIHGLLAEDGIVVLTTGDIGSVYARIAGPRWRLLTPPQHQFFFSRETLSALLARTGFEIVALFHPWKLVPLRLMLYQLGPGVKAALGPLGRMPLGVYVNLFDAMFVVARKSIADGATGS
jgi:SAM-dependent methyltransferase